MTRTFWGGMMVASLLTTAGAGYFLNSQGVLPGSFPITMEKEVPLTPAAPPDQAPPTEPAPAVEKVAEAPAPEGTRNILFRFPRASAKSVYIVGDFNEWRRQPLIKGEKGWDISLRLLPGNYEYLFVVEEKRTKDPNNKQVKNGKSVITVKPLSN